MDLAIPMLAARQAQTAPREAAPPPRRRPRTVYIGGWALNPLVLDCRELDKLGAADVMDACAGRVLRGVLLQRLLLRAEPAFIDRGDFKRVAIVAQGFDGQRVLFSWSELFHTAVGEAVYVAFDGPGAPLAGAGPYALVSLHERNTSPRRVDALVSVDIHKLW